MTSLPKFFEGSSHSQRSEPVATNDSFSIESVESSVQNVVKIWERRKLWRSVFNTTNQDSNRPPWRTHLISFLDSTPAHVVTVSLLLIDLVLTVLELSSSLISCRSPTSNHKGAEAWYHWVGIAILSLLSAKTVALVVGLGRSFFKRPGCVIDGVVVVGALLLEVFVERKGGGLIIVASLWRVVRVVESAFELSDEAIEAKIEGIVWELERLKEENRRVKDIAMEKDKVIEMLQEDLNQCRDDSHSS